MADTGKRSYYYGIGLFGAAALTLLDQLTKYLAVRFLKGAPGQTIMPGVFELLYLENRGAAFGMFRDRQWMFIVIASIMIAAAIYVYLFLPAQKYYHGIRICTVLIAAGAAGNMIDRLLHHYVIDFLYFSLIDFPVFNIADCYVVVGVILLILLLFTLYRSENFEFLNPKK